jgi:hypothetical protein
MHCFEEFGDSNRVLLVVLPLLLALLITPSQSATGQQVTRLFTVADDIALTELEITPTFSPDDRYFFVTSHRGRLDIDRAESSIRIYSVADVVAFLSHPERTGEVSPVWIISKATCKKGPIIDAARWLADSSGIAFLAKTITGNDQLFLAEIHARTVAPLTPENRHVTAFDVRSRAQFVYTVLSSAIRKRAVQDKQAAAVAGTGRSLFSLLFPEDVTQPDVWAHDLSELWAVRDGKRFRVIDTSSHRPVPIHLYGQRTLALRPDGHSIVTALTVRDIPAEWEGLYPPRSPSSAYRVRAGHQDPYAFMGQQDVSEYTLLDLDTGEATSLTKAPIGVGWAGHAHAKWSADGKAVVMSYTFLPPKNRGVTGQNRPCIAVADRTTGKTGCVDRLKDKDGVQSGRGNTWRLIVDADFVRGSKDLVRVTYQDDEDDDTTRSATCFARQADDSWRIEASMCKTTEDKRPVEVSIRQGINSAQVVIATDKKTSTSRVVWEPNRQLRKIRLGDVSVLRWNDSAGRSWFGGLYKPPDYLPGKRYPLVIQTHGFSEHLFVPSGSYPTVFAAQELAAVGFLVLQVIEDCPASDAPEGPCQVAGYEAAVERLSRDGLIDADNVGIIGYSHTCYHVLEALTTSSLRFKAALIADGINLGYFEYIQAADLDGQNSFAHFADAVIGGPPFGATRDSWLKRSPEFNLDKVNSPVEVIATNGGFRVLQMWEPYAVLRYLHKPVDLLILNSEEHPITNPAERLVSQGTVVDWFRFWLQGYEDPNPAKIDQYSRWKVLHEGARATQAERQ